MMCFSRRPLTLSWEGIRRLRSMTVLSRNGTRHSSEVAMVIRSVSMSRSSGSWVK